MDLDLYRDARNAYLKAWNAYNKDPEDSGIAATFEAAKIVFNHEIERINSSLVQKHQNMLMMKTS